MNLTLQRYHICIAVVKYLGNYFQEIPVLVCYAENNHYLCMVE